LRKILKFFEKQNLNLNAKVKHTLTYQIFSEHVMWQRVEALLWENDLRLRPQDNAFYEGQLYLEALDNYMNSGGNMQGLILLSGGHFQ